MRRRIEIARVLLHEPDAAAARRARARRRPRGAAPHLGPAGARWRRRAAPASSSPRTSPRRPSAATASRSSTAAASSPTARPTSCARTSPATSCACAASAPRSSRATITARLGARGPRSSTATSSSRRRAATSWSRASPSCSRPGACASIATRRPTLADVFAKLTGRGLACVDARRRRVIAGAASGRDLRRFFRQPSRVVGSARAAADPLGGAGRRPRRAASARGGGAGVGYLQYFYPGIVVLTVLFTAIFSTISVIEDRHHGFLQAVLVAPVSRVGAGARQDAWAAWPSPRVQAAILLALAPLAGFSLAAMNWPLLAARAPAVGARLHRARLRDGLVDRLDAGLPRGHERRAHPAVDALGRDVPALGRQPRGWPC